MDDDDDDDDDDSTENNNRGGGVTLRQSLVYSMGTGRSVLGLTLQRGVTGTARMLHALTHSSISRQVREQM